MCHLGSVPVLLQVPMLRMSMSGKSASKCAFARLKSKHLMRDVGDERPAKR